MCSSLSTGNEGRDGEDEEVEDTWAGVSRENWGPAGEWEPMSVGEWKDGGMASRSPRLMSDISTLCSVSPDGMNEGVTN